MKGPEPLLAAYSRGMQGRPPAFTPVLTDAVEEGLCAAALVDKNGNTVELAGDIAEEIAMPLVALVLYRLKSSDLADRLFDGEVVSVALDDRHAVVAVAKRQLFVIALLDEATPALLSRVAELRDDVTKILAEASEHEREPWRGGGGGGDSGPDPAELALIELGVTVPRGRGKA